MASGSGRRTAITVVMVAILLLAVWLLLASRDRANVAASRDMYDVAAQRRSPIVSRTIPAPLGPRRDPLSDSARGGASEEEDAGSDEIDALTENLDELTADLVPMPDADELAAAWSAVDFDEVRRAMPDNIYFEMSAPTTDEAVLAERAAQRSRWNDEYGKVLSGTGSEEEVLAYYDVRARISSDYLEFTTYLLDNHGQSLAERDRGLLELARRLHAARLQEIPRQVEEALARKRQQDAAREAWLADEAAFAGQNADSD